MGNTSPQKCFSLAVYTAEKYFSISIGPYDVIQIIKGENDIVIQLLLQQLRDVWSHHASSDSKHTNPHSSNASIQQQDSFGRSDHHHQIGYDNNNAKQSVSPPRHNVHPNHNPLMSRNHHYDDSRPSQLHRMGVVSNSTGHLNSYSSTAQFHPSSSLYGNETNSPVTMDKTTSTGGSGGGSAATRQRISSVGEQVPTMDSTMKGSSIYRQPDSSMSNSKPFRHSISNLNQSSSHTPQPLSKQDSWMGGASSNRYSVPNSSPSTVEYSFSSDLPMPVTIYRTSSRTSIHSASSRSSLDRDDQHITLAHLSNAQSIPSHLISPEYQTERSLRDSYRRTSNGGGSSSVGGGGTMGSTPGTTLATDGSGQLLEELNKRITELTELMNEERNVVKIFRTSRSH